MKSKRRQRMLLRATLVILPTLVISWLWAWLLEPPCTYVVSAIAGIIVGRLTAPWVLEPLFEERR